ncbi:tetratricopeptide repeat protein [Pedobacter cryotolerans]|uniref:Tetratricopeptide repeat protein n=1 Tax=Pedobacter cryotolerans TaxID=2571270 RepID=A0A4U1BZ44_9SPHI|nr:tetratricopeptide repeat protein [Pedobacter cryotolerans]TKB98040.1 tetratricopeptide repeat protein [Pedobacter cryotolerans]
MKNNLAKLYLLTLVLLLFSFRVGAVENLTKRLEIVMKMQPKMAIKELYPLINKYIIDAPLDRIISNKDQLITALEDSEIPHKQAYIYEIEANSAKNLLQLSKAKFYAQKGLEEPKILEDQLIRLLILLANVETSLENYVVAIENYKIIENVLARQKRNQYRKQLIVNHIGLADVYLKIGLYKKSLNTLKEGVELAKDEDLPDINNLLYNKIAIVYFYLRKPKLLEYYTNKALEKNAIDDEVTFHRLMYMKLLLKNDSAAIDEIRKVISSPKDDDELMSGYHLAQAYTEFNMPEKAKKFILIMLGTGDLKKLPFLSSKLNKLLIDVYLKESNVDSAMYYYKKTIEQLTQYTEKQSSTENISNILKYRDIKNRYDMAEENLEVRKNYLFLSLIIGFMSILALFLLYRAALAKKRFNKLTYERLNNEIAHINSHDVRKHLSNILGIINVIQLSNSKTSTYAEMEDVLLESVESLDTSIKNIAAKIDHTKSK